MSTMEQEALDQANRELADIQRQKNEERVSREVESGVSVDYNKLARDILNKQPDLYNVPKSRMPKSMLAIIVFLVFAAVGVWVWVTFF